MSWMRKEVNDGLRRARDDFVRARRPRASRARTRASQAPHPRTHSIMRFYFFVLCLTAIVAQPPDACSTTANDKDENTCLKAEGWGCNWCASKAVPSRCVSWENAKHLPAPSFECGNATRTDCSNQMSNETCQTQSGCGWCTSFTVKPSCTNCA